MNTTIPDQRLTTISFDADMTLWDFQKVMLHSLAITLKEIQRRLPGQATHNLTIERMIEIRDEVSMELKSKSHKLEEIRLQAFARTLDYIGQSDPQFAAELNALYLKHRFEDIELYPDVLPCLDALRNNLTVGLLSNGNSYPDKCGLEGRFCFAIFSQDVGVNKPDQRMFLEVCKVSDCAPHQLIHIGDSLSSDVVGANGVGAVSVWLNREGKPNVSEINPDHVISSLSELAEIIDRY